MTGFIENKQLWGNLGNRIAPSVAKVDTGWVAGEQPPHEWENSERYQSQRRLNHCIDMHGINGVKPGRATGPEYISGALWENTWLTESDNRWLMGERVDDACLAWNYERDMPMLVYVRDSDIVNNQIRCIDAWDFKDNHLSYAKDIQTAYVPTGSQDTKVCASRTKLYVHYRHSFNTEVARYDLVNWTGVPEAEWRSGQTTYTEMIMLDLLGTDDTLLLFKGGGSTVDILKTIEGFDFTNEQVGNGNLDVGGGYSTIDAGVTPRDADGKIWFMSHVSGSSHHLNSAFAYNLGDPGVGPFTASIYDGEWGNICSTGESTLVTGHFSNVLGSNQIIGKYSVGQNGVSEMHEIMNCNQDSSILVGFDGLNVYVLYDVASNLIYNGGPTERHWSWTRFNAREFARYTDMTAEADRLRYPSTNLYGDRQTTARLNQHAKMFFDGVNMWVVQKEGPLYTYIYRIPGIRQRVCHVGR